MNFQFFFRILTVALKLQKKVPLFSEKIVRKTVTKIRVRYAETDQMGVVYHGNYILFLEEARTEWLRKLGLSYKWMEANNVMLPVIQVHIDYKTPAYYDDVLSITTKLRKIPTFRIEFDYEIHNENDTLIATASVSLVFMDMESKRPIKAPQYLLEKLMDHDD